MTLADDLKPLVYAIRAIPGQLGLRTHSVTILTTTWGGTHTGAGAETGAEVTLAEANGYPPKVRWLSDEQRVLGDIDIGSIEIGPITPNHTGGGTSFATLAGQGLATGKTLHIRVTGPKHPTGALYRVTDVRGDRATKYSLRAVPVSAA